jgi:hypothetical protein
MTSLLGLFYPRIRGSQEDIASSGLAHILNGAESTRRALAKFIQHECGLDLHLERFITQSTGKERERPDISGYDEHSGEVLIIETKFWSSLTEKQPNAYLDRLTEPSVLLFICPSLRVRSLYDELIKKLPPSVFQNQEETNQRIICYNQKYILIKTWDEILQLLRQQLVADNNVHLISDIDQIIGFCKIIDNEAFLPIVSEDLSPSIGRRIWSYYKLIDGVSNALVSGKHADTKNLKATGQVYGYTRYLHIKEFGVALEVDFDFDYWSTYADTPFWITFKEITNGKWVTSGKMRESCQNIASILKMKVVESQSGNLAFALYPVIGATEDVVVNQMTEQIVRLSNEIEKALSDAN